MAISFPSSPAVNDTFTTGGRTWYWTGTAWKAQGTATGVIAATAPITYNAQTKTVGLDQTAVNTANDARYPQLADNEIIPLDNFQNSFDGTENRFLPKYQGTTLSITNPYKLQIYVNGIYQTLSFREYVYQCDLPRDGFMVDNQGYIAFTEAVPPGSKFDGRIVPGPATTTRNNTYPFNPADIMLGA